MPLRSFSACLLASAALALATSPLQAAAQSPTAKASASGYKTPRNIHGQPDLEGTWTNATLTPLEREAKYGNRLVMTPEELAEVEKAEQEYIAEGNKPTDPSLKVTDLPVNCGRGFSGTNCGYNRGWTDPGDTVMRVNGQPRTSFITTTPDGRVPPRKAGAPVPAANRLTRAGMGPNDNPEQKSLGERCILSFGRSAGPPMLPLLYNNNYQIAQSKDHVAILVEMVHDVRNIRLNTKSHLASHIRPWMGDSIGWYEGDTLVVETTNFPRAQQFQGSWENLKVTERFTRTSKDSILYQFRIEDPTIWDAPWGGEYEFTPSKGPVYEYACHEGNYALEGILAGARAEEAAASAQASAGGATPR